MAFGKNPISGFSSGDLKSDTGQLNTSRKQPVAVMLSEKAASASKPDYASSPTVQAFRKKKKKGAM